MIEIHLFSRIYHYVRRRLLLRLFRIEHPNISIVTSTGYFCHNSIEKTSGGGNYILIGECSSISNCTIIFNGSNNVLRIMDGVNLHNMRLTFEDDNNLIEIGSRTTVENNVEICACESKFVNIGNDCMLSHDISIRTTDSHSIFSVGGERINEAKNVTIGNNVWIGCQSLILKGTTIPDGCIIGARSTVTQGLKANKNSLIVGQPAKKVKDDVYWKRERC